MCLQSNDSKRLQEASSLSPIAVICSKIHRNSAHWKSRRKLADVNQLKQVDTSSGYSHSKLHTNPKYQQQHQTPPRRCFLTKRLEHPRPVCDKSLTSHKFPSHPQRKPVGHQKASINIKQVGRSLKVLSVLQNVSAFGGRLLSGGVRSGSGS